MELLKPFIAMSPKSVKHAELEVKSNKKGDLLRGFRQFNKGKSTQRTFLNQIIELVA